MPFPIFYTSGGGGDPAALAEHAALIDAHQIATTAATFASGVLTLNLNTSKIFTATLTTNVTSVIVQNWNASPQPDQATIILTYSGAVRTIAWPSTWLWVGKVAGAAPTTTHPKVIVDIWSPDGGTTIFANAAPYGTA